jgi:hypothetical protein
MEGRPLLGVLRGLVLDGEEQADFAADPSGYMQRAGYDDVSADDMGEAIGLVADTLPPDVAHAVTTAAAGPEGEAAGDEGATGMLERLASIDAEDVPPLPIPPPAEPGDDVDDGLDDTDTLDDGGDATAFGDVTTDFDDAAAIDADAGADADGLADRDEDGAADAEVGDRNEDGSVDHRAEGEDDGDADMFGPDFDPFAEEAAEPSLESVEATDGAVRFADAHDVDDDPIDFGEGIGTADAAAAPGGPAEDTDPDASFAPDDAFGSDAGFEEPALDEPSEMDAAYGEDADLGDGLDDGYDDDTGSGGDVDDIGLF